MITRRCSICDQAVDELEDGDEYRVPEDLRADVERAAQEHEVSCRQFVSTCDQLRYKPLTHDVRKAMIAEGEDLVRSHAPEERSRGRELLQRALFDRSLCNAIGVGTWAGHPTYEEFMPMIHWRGYQTLESAQETREVVGWPDDGVFLPASGLWSPDLELK